MCMNFEIHIAFALPISCTVCVAGDMIFSRISQIGCFFLVPLPPPVILYYVCIESQNENRKTRTCPYRHIECEDMNTYYYILMIT